jgi:hypothetical protein
MTSMTTSAMRWRIKEYDAVMAPVRLHSPDGTRSAVVLAEPSYAETGAWLIRVVLREGEPAVSSGTEYGPYAADELPSRFQQAVESLLDEGYERAGSHLTIAALKDPSRRRRALAALYLGRRRCREAVPALIAAADGAIDEVCSIIDALGAISDARAVPLVQTFASRKLLSRRRSGVEALRRLGDDAALEQVLQQLRQRLEPTLQTALDEIDGQDDEAQAAAALEKAVLELPGKRRGRATDALYELGSPVTVAAARSLLAQLPIEQPFVWRYTKSILKRAMQRDDWSTIGWLAHRIETCSQHTTGTRSKLRSGRDGKQRETVVFGRQTQRYVLRSVWRYLRELARYRPPDYPPAAAEAIVHYSSEDRQIPSGRYGDLAGCYLLNRVLWSAGPRLELIDRKLKFRFRTSSDVKPLDQVREEPYSELWDATPHAYLALLAGAQLPEVQEYALRAVRERHAQLLEQATPAQLHGMVATAYPPTVVLALAELDRRFDPLQPDWRLIFELAASEHTQIRTIAIGWLERCAPLWTGSLERSLDLLGLAPGDTRAAVARLLLAALPTADAGYRRQLAERLYAILREGEEEEGDHAAHAQVARDGLAGELAELLTIEQVWQLIDGGSDLARSVGGAVLARRTETIEEIGLKRLLHLAQHEAVTVREAAMILIRSNLPLLRQDPSLLLVLAESEWPDTRSAVLKLLRDELTLDDLGAAGIVGLCDSNRVEVQNLGRDLVRQHFQHLDPGRLVSRLVEHPHANMQSFIMDLIEAHLRPGADALAGVQPFLRSVLLSLQPSCQLKQRAVDFLTRRGEADADEAALATGLLGEVIRRQGRADFEQALVALSHLSVAWPELATCIEAEVVA